MKRMTKKEVKQLLLVDTPPCVSMYIPLEQADTEDEVAGTYKRLLASAEDLLAKSYSGSVADRLLSPLKSFSLRDFADVKSGTLVLFKSPTTEGYVLVPKALPGLAVASDSFHLKPLLEFLIPHEEFYLLALDTDRAKLFRGDALSFEVHREFRLADETYETVSENPLSRSTVWGTLNRFLLSIGFSGLSSDRARFFSSIDKHVKAVLRASSAPLLLAGKRGHTRLYRSINTYRPLVKPSLPYRVDEENLVELESAHETASAITARHYRHCQKRALQELKIAARLDRVRIDVEGVVNALVMNQASTLFFRKGEMSWGTINWDSGHVRRNAFQRDGRDDDLIDDCIEKAIAQKCRIVALERYQMPELGSIAVILRASATPEPLHVSAPMRPSLRREVGFEGVA